MLILAKVNAVSAVGGKRETAVKPSAGCNWRPQRYNWHNVSKYNGGIQSLEIIIHIVAFKEYKVNCCIEDVPGH
ncbi:hypothetical protein Tco_0773771 [Tanacetum coccineum]|uniref:Uncharacterized protein n=1 Tax=Tanacetum coccineum TaxID=301880 RepID=A0ABQ4ZQ54_9ASTR